MSVRFLHFICALITSSLLVTSASATDAPPTILVLGDSLSAGFGMDVPDTWTALLQGRLETEGYGYSVVNASISGDTTGNGLRRLPRALKIHQPEIVLIELGGNDGLRGISVEIMKSNLEQMILKIRDAGADVILAGILIPPNYGDEYTADFAAVYPALAAQHSTQLIPFFMEGVALDNGLMQPDGIHPNKQAQPKLMETVWVTLEPMLSSDNPN
jgi:acyl-CoA thioesterase-1